MNKTRILLGISGGVDSGVSALLLQKAGYEVIGATMNLFEQNCNKECNNSVAIFEAQKLCNYLEIPHYVLDLKKEFYKYVIKDFICQYANCKTPNPCIECNRYLKFGAMYKKAEELDCKYIATGHYAKTEYSEEYKRWVLKKSKARNKDQSYVLWNIQKEMLEHIIFPLSEFENKDQIREIARNNNLDIADKPDSEDICFIPNGNYKQFLEEKAIMKPKNGNIVNTKGEILGTHNGLYNYTIGQRKGLGISNKVPLFIIGFNSEKNELIVGEQQELYSSKATVTNINLLLVDEINDWLKVEVKTRYSSKSAKAKIRQKDKDIEIIFEEPQRAITPGQSAVFYIDDYVVGGGKIIK